jgi:hypothetical protein
MKRTLAIWGGTFLVAVLCSLTPTDTPAVEAQQHAQEDIGALIDRASLAYGVSPWQMRRIAWCESRWFPGAYNRQSGASGLFQFLRSTWAYASSRAGWGGYSPFHAEANAYSAAWLMRHVGPNQWVCR